MPLGIIFGRITPARGNLEHRPLSGAVEEDNATQPWTVLVDIKGVTSVALFPTEPPVAAPAAVTRSVASNNSGAGDCDHNACIIGTIVTAATAF